MVSHGWLTANMYEYVHRRTYVEKLLPEYTFACDHILEQNGEMVT